METDVQDSITVKIAHSFLKKKFPEQKIKKQMTIDALKRKLFYLTGTCPLNMVLLLKDASGKQLHALTDDSKPFGHYCPSDGCTVSVIETNFRTLTNMEWLGDGSKVKSYDMSDEAYSKRDNTFRKFKQEMLQRKQGAAADSSSAQDDQAQLPDQPSAQSDAPPAVDDSYLQELAAGINVGDRCCVQPGDRRGTVRYVGQVDGLAPGYWVGIEYDEAVGKHDGTVKATGKRYFNAPPGRGAFVRPDGRLLIGDYPKASEELEEGDEI